MLPLLVALGLLASQTITSSTTTQNGVYEAKDPKPTLVSSSSPKQLLEAYSDLYGVSYAQMYYTIECESNFNPKAVNPKDPSYGIAQFVPSTFYRYASVAGIENPDIDNTAQQIQLMAYMFSIHQEHQWTCWRNLFNTP